MLEETLTVINYGATHLIKVPNNLSSRNDASGLGLDNFNNEHQFWGQHQPIASVQTPRVGMGEKGSTNLMDQRAALIDEMINDANRNLSPEEKAAYRASQAEFGNQITPAQRAFIIGEFESVASKNLSGAKGIANIAQDEQGFLLSDETTGRYKKVSGGIDDTIERLKTATTPEEMTQIIDSMTREKPGAGARSK